MGYRTTLTFDLEIDAPDPEAASELANEWADVVRAIGECGDSLLTVLHEVRVRDTKVAKPWPQTEGR